MPSSTERERAYDLPDGVRIPQLVGRGGVARVAGNRTDVLETVYHDTPDLRLARARTALRHRRGGPDAGWHLKVHLGDDRRAEERRPDAATPPVDLLDRVRAVARGQPLGPVARVVTRRRERELRARDGRVLALLAEDDVDAEDLTTGAQHSWCEVEVVLVEGDHRLFDAIEARLRGAGARPLRASKLERTLGGRLAAAERRPPGGAAGAVVRYLRAQRDGIVAAYPGARAGDPDAVVDMAAAARRLRATLRTFRGLWDRSSADRVRTELSWLDGRLAPLRDPLVVSDRLLAATRAEPSELVSGPVRARLRQRLAGTGARAHAGLRAALGSRRFMDLLTALDGLAGSAGRRRGRWVRGRVRRAVRRADARLGVAPAAPDRGAGEPDRDTGAPDVDRSLSTARRAYARARYAVEAVRPTGGRPARRLARRLRAVQDELDGHRGGVLARKELRRQAGAAYRDGEDTFPYGLLYGRIRQDAERVAERAGVLARRAARRKVRAWLS